MESAGPGAGGAGGGGGGGGAAAAGLAAALEKAEARGAALEAELETCRAEKWGLLMEQGGLREQVARLEAEAESFRGVLAQLDAGSAAAGGAGASAPSGRLDAGRRLKELQDALEERTGEVRDLQDEIDAREAEVQRVREELAATKGDLLEARALGERKVNAALSATSKERIRALTLEKELEALTDRLQEAVAGTAEVADVELAHAEQTHRLESADLRARIQALESEVQTALAIKERYAKELVKVLVDREQAAREEDNRGRVGRQNVEELERELERARASVGDMERALRRGREGYNLLRSKLDVREHEVAELQGQLQVVARQSDQEKADRASALAELLEVTRERDQLRVRAAAQDGATRAQQAERRKLEAGLRGMLDTLASVGSPPPGSSEKAAASADGDRLRTLKGLLEETIGGISSCLDSKLRLAQALGGSPPRKT